MAFVALSPQTLNITITQGLDQAWLTPVIQDLTNTAVNFSAWTGLTAKLSPTSASPTGSDVTFGAVTSTATAGVLQLKTAASDLATASQGQALLRIYGKPTSGDENQLLCTGVVTLQAA